MSSTTGEFGLRSTKRDDLEELQELKFPNPALETTAWGEKLIYASRNYQAAKGRLPKPKYDRKEVVWPGQLYHTLPIPIGTRLKLKRNLHQALQ